MTRFQLVVLDAEHLILTTEEKMRREDVLGAQRAFELWRENGGALIIGDCLTRDRHAVSIDLDLDGTDVTRADITSRAQGPDIQGTQGIAQDADTRPRGLIQAPDSESQPKSSFWKRSP